MDQEIHYVGHHLDNGYQDCWIGDLIYWHHNTKNNQKLDERQKLTNNLFSVFSFQFVVRTNESKNKIKQTHIRVNIFWINFLNFRNWPLVAIHELWIRNNGVFTGVFSCWRVACEDAGRAAYNQLCLHITGEYNRQQASISC